MTTSLGTAKAERTSASIVRFIAADGITKVGLLIDDAVSEFAAPSMADLLHLTLNDLRDLVEHVRRSGTGEIDVRGVTLLPPIDGRTEVWGAGVTYKRSQSARAEESSYERVYLEVYDATRPELFLKAPAWRVLSDGPGGLRPDADDSVAEPELALVVNRHAQIVGALVCNDLTSRSIEAENPIYLPQAKIFRGSTILSSAIKPWWDIDTPEDLGIEIAVRRGDSVFFEGSTRTSSMRRGYAELVSWLFRAEYFPDGVVLSTGTGIVPALGDSLRSGDIVRVAIEQVGTLTNEMCDDADVFDGLLS